MESVGGYAYFVSEGTLSADLKFLFFFFLKTFFYTFFEFELRRPDSNRRPLGYEPNELPTAPLRDVVF